MGRNKKLSDSARKRGESALSKATNLTRIYLGEAFDAWIEAKETTGAKMIVDVYDSGEPRDRPNLVVGVKTQSDELVLQLPDRPTDY